MKRLTEDTLRITRDEIDGEEPNFRQLLADRLKEVGGLRKLAREANVSPTFVHQIINGIAKPGPKIAAYLGYKTVTYWAKIDSPESQGITASPPANNQSVVIKSIQDLKPYKDVLGLGDRYWLFIGTKGSSFLFTFDNSKEQRFEEKLLTNAEVQDFINLGRFFRHFWLPIRFHTNLTSPGDPQS